MTEEEKTPLIDSGHHHHHIMGRGTNDGNKKDDFADEKGYGGTSDSPSTSSAEAADGMNGKDKDGSKDDDKTETLTSERSISLLELFRYATPADSFFIFLGSVAAFAHGAGWPVLMVVFGEMTDDLIGFDPPPDTTGIPIFTLPINTTLPPLPDYYKEFDQTMRDYAIIYAYVGAAVLFVSYIQVVFWNIPCERQSHRLRKAFFRAILRQEISWFDTHQSGELTSRLADDLERVKEGIGDKVALCIQSLAQLVVGFGIGFWKSWELTLVMMSLTPILAIAGSTIMFMIAGFAKQEQTLYAAAGSVAEEVLSSIRTVAAFGGEHKETKRYDAELLKAKDVGIKKGLTMGLGFGAFMLILFSSYALAFWYGPRMVADGKISGGDVMTVFFCVMIGSFSISSASPALSNVSTARGAAAVLYDIIDAKPSIDSSSTKGLTPERIDGSIEFSKVKFMYPTRPDVPVLQGLNLVAQPGQTVALVGPSGCGKSTTVNLLLRFYNILEGTVKLDGNNITDLNIQWLRQNIGVVSQEPILFGCTIEENIMYGRDGVTKADVIAAAKDANAHNFISKLPKGYDTLVGERGAQLSGGQKQRVAIARALVRNPRILLLDEATSALDSESEKVVQAALDKALQGRTTLVIAHRLSTIQNADVIYAFDEGRIVESGSHAELMKQGGIYKQLVTLQQLDGEAFMSIKIEKPGSVKLKPDEKPEVTESTGQPLSPEKRELQKQLSRQLSHSASYKRQKSRGQSVSSYSESVKGVDEEVKLAENVPEEEEDLPEIGYMDILKMNSPEWFYIMIGCLASMVNGVTMPLFAIFFAEVFTVFTLPEDEMKEEARFWSLMFLVLGITMFFGNLFSMWMFSISGENLTMRLRGRAFKCMLRQDIGYYDDARHSTGALTTRLASDASNVKGATGFRIGTIIQSATTVFAALIIAFLFGWQLALVVLACVPVLAVTGAINMQITTQGHKKDKELLEDAGKMAAEAIENIRTVAALSLEQNFYDRYCEYLEEPFKQGKRNANVYALAFAFAQSSNFFLYAACFRYGGFLVSMRVMEPDDIFRVFFAISFAGVSLGQASAMLPDYAKAKYSAQLMLQLFNLEPKIDVYSKDGLRPSEVTGNIEYSNIEFIYPTRPDVKVLKGLDIAVNSGQTVALVGESGCGKSTLVSLLERFYDPHAGNLTLDNDSIKALNLPWLRSHMSVVSQEPILFACSIGENISYGVEGEMSMEEIISVAKMANIHDFVASLPMGYDTLTGEKGTQLSGGQKQRVAIARALARNPQILLLDEATSALDSESEKVVQAALDVAMEGRTCLVIAHRLSTIQNANVIAVIRDGVVVEAGTHQELLAKKGHYHTLASGQRK